MNVRILTMWIGLLATPVAAQQPQIDGSLEFSGQQHGQKGISGTTLAKMLQGLPQETPKFLLLTECYGGLIARNPAINTLRMTAVAAGNSAQQPEVGYYGGYHDDAVRALKPEDGRTAQNVHDAGVAGKHALETPVTTGTLTLGNFSLEKIKATGPIRTRVIVIYAGKPSVRQEFLKTVNGHTVPEPTGMAGEQAELAGYPKTEVSDVNDRQVIINNFAGEQGTHIITAGGPGGDGWKYPGTEQGLKSALDEAREFLAAEPTASQFILVGLDHGDVDGALPVQQPCPPNSRCSLAPVLPVPPQRSVREDMLREPDNRPSFAVFAEIPAGSFANMTPAQFALELRRSGDGFTRTLPAASLVGQDTDGSGDIGDAPDEGMSLIFPVDERQFIDEFFDRPASATLINDAQTGLQVREIRFTSGSIAHPQRPEGRARRPPWAWIIGALLVIAIAAAVLRMRQRRP